MGKYHISCRYETRYYGRFRRGDESIELGTRKLVECNSIEVTRVSGGYWAKDRHRYS
jgi:hypothetical protein